PDEKGEKLLVAALNKTIGKIEKNQQADGTFAGNHGWATVLSQGLANKGLNRAAQMGAAVQPQSLDRIQGQVASNFDDKSKTFNPATGAGGSGAGAGYSGSKSDPKSASRPATSGRVSTSGEAAGPTDAGVPIYGASQNLTNCCDVLNTLCLAEKKARETLARKDAPKEERERAQATLKHAQDVRKLQEDATKGASTQVVQP